MNECALLNSILPLLPSRSDVVMGAGDDAAVIELGSTLLLAAADQLNSDVHFDLSSTPPEHAGAKLLRRNLSDIAAMGGEAKWALATLSANAVNAEWITRFHQGLTGDALKWGIAVIGGDIGSLATPGVASSLTILGTVEKRALCLRANARPGDLALVTGSLGRSYPTEHHLHFTPRLAEARHIAGDYSNCMIDLSDGLALDALRVAVASNVAIELNSAAFPPRDGATVKEMLGDGEDYELLIFMPPENFSRLRRNWPFECHLTCVGEVKSSANPGVFVDGIHVGGMTLEEARAALSGLQPNQHNLFSVTAAIGNKTWVFDSNNVPAARDIDLVVEQAYAIGRTNSADTIGTRVTPFKERSEAAIALRENNVHLTAAASYDHEAVRRLVDEIALYVTRPPTDAAIQSFDYVTRTFSFVDGQPGVTLDRELLYQKVTASLDNWEKEVTVTVDPVVTQPAITKDQLAANFRMIAAYTTDTTRDSNRNHNISLASQAINGTALMPGETFSFNKTTGQRTINKGYREAGAISGGQSIDEVGGGICQVSSTLFNAVARADLEIISRTPHAWPSTYVNRGEDATVNWPNLDFTFKNNKSSPVFIITYYNDRKCSAEIWGYSAEKDVAIELQSTIVKTTDPPMEVKYVQNSNLPIGTSKEIIHPRTGYVVDTYKVWYQGGQELRREKMHTSTYKTYQRTIEYN